MALSTYFSDSFNPEDLLTFKKKKTVTKIISVGLRTEEDFHTTQIGKLSLQDFNCFASRCLPISTNKIRLDLFVRLSEMCLVLVLQFSHPMLNKLIFLSI